MSMIYELKHEIVEFMHTQLGGKLPATGQLNPHCYDGIEVNIREPIDGYCTRWVISALGLSLSIEEGWLVNFMAMLESFESHRVKTVLNMIESPKDNTITLVPYVPIELCEDDELFNDDNAVGVVFESVDTRTEKLYRSLNQDIGHINRLFEHASSLYNRDTGKVKTDEIYIGFNTKYPGSKTAFFLTATRVPAIYTDNQSITRSLVPMEEELAQSLFSYSAYQKEKANLGLTVMDEIQQTLNRMNETIQTHFKTVKEWNSQLVLEYAENKINTGIIPIVVMSHICEFSYFGGKNLNLVDFEEGDKNAEVCAELIDQVMRSLFTHLLTIPIPEGSGIDHYAIDYDGLGIYGRDHQNKLVSAMVDARYQFATHFENRYSKSFLDVFKQNLKTVKNKHVFTQVGRITHK